MRPRVPFKNLAGPVPAFPLAQGGVALLVVDVHRYTADPTAGYGRLARERGIARELAEFYEQLEQVLDNLRWLVDGCRSRRVPVLFSRLVARAEADVTAHARVTGFWTLGSNPEAAFLPVLAPHDGEPVIDKTAASPFSVPAFEEALAAFGTRYLLVAGVFANCAVEQAARDAADRGYGVVVVSDGCAVDTWALHTEIMTRLVGGLIRVRTAASVLEMLDGTRT